MSAAYDRMIESGVLHKCEGCGRFVSDDRVWSDHDDQGCRYRIEDPESGLDTCHCYLAPFCSEACANRWHRMGVA